jgi:hypothetical protein
VIGGGILAAWIPFWRFVSFLSSFDFMRTASGRPSIGTFFLPSGLADGLWIVGIAMIVFVVVTREMQESPYITRQEIARATDATPVIEARIFAERTAEELMNFFAGHTTVDANKLLEVYMGKWLQVSGVFDDVTAHHLGLTVYIELPNHSSVFMQFEPEWHDRLLMLKRGSIITVVGKIHRVSWTNLALRECELIRLPGDQEATMLGPSIQPASPG